MESIGRAKKSGQDGKVRTMDLSPDVSEFADFIRNQSHILRDYPSLMFQQAYNWPDNTVAHRVANKQLDSGTKTHPRLRWVNKPQQIDPCLATLRGHSRTVETCAYSPDGLRIVSGRVTVHSRYGMQRAVLRLPPCGGIRIG